MEPPQLVPPVVTRSLLALVVVLQLVIAHRRGEEAHSFLNDRLQAAAAGVGQAAPEPPMDVLSIGGGTFSVQSPSPRTGSDCVSGGKVYPNGATWLPVMGPFGRLTCELCRCSAGTVECSHVRCPTPTCARPQTVLGQCCPLCPNSKGMDSAPSRPDLPIMKCIPARSLLVWRSHGGANVSQYIQYIFERPGRTGLSEKHEWMFRRDQIENFRVLRLGDSGVSALKRVGSYDLLGVVTQKRLRKFHDRERAVQQKCKARCQDRVLRLERKLRVRQPKQRRGCKSNERQVDV